MDTRRRRRIALGLALAPLAVLGFVATSSLRAGARQGERVPAAAPQRTSPVRGLVLARPFGLGEAYEHAWRVERPSARSGWLLVLAVDPAYRQPTQRAMPVLVLGDQTVECVNFGAETGRVVAIVPSALDEGGDPALDLGTSPAWFASPELPERVGAAWIAAERARARPDQVTTFTAAEVAAARERGGATLRVARREDLDREAATLVLEQAPDERDTAEGMLVPRVR